jgi:DNA-binding LytR/AlgR family response regulator
MSAERPCVLVGVTGCIAAYKAGEIVRGLQKAGVRVKVVMTEHGTHFVDPVTFRALTHEKVAVDLFDDPSDPIHHISLAQECDVFLIAPCTANVMAKVACGIADDLLSTTALATTATLAIAPAANVHMYEAAATQENMATLRRRGVRAPLAFLAHTTAYAYEAFRVDAMQYLHIPFRPEQLTALLDRATEPEYGPVIQVTTAMGLRALPFADIEYLECTHHVVHYHLASGEDVASLSLRVPFSEVAKPLLADARFLQPHRSYVVNLAAAAQLSSGELWMRSGARVPIPRGREPAVRAAFRAFLEG